jgi:hypothetical protein
MTAMIPAHSLLSVPPADSMHASASQLRRTVHTFLIALDDPKLPTCDLQQATCSLVNYSQTVLTRVLGTSSSAHPYVGSPCSARSNMPTMRRGWGLCKHQPPPCSHRMPGKEAVV